VSALVDAGAASWRWMFKQAANPASFEPQDGEPVGLLAFIRGVRSDDLFASATQGDVAGVIDAAEFATALAGVRATPQRYDRMSTATKTYTVEEWRGSPNDDAPVFFKILLRGGGQ
jgi:hypothetical protein